MGLAFWGWQRRGACVPFHRRGSPLRAASSSSCCLLAGSEGTVNFLPGDRQISGEDGASRARVVVHKGPRKSRAAFEAGQGFGVTLPRTARGIALPGPDVPKSLRFAGKHRFSVTPNRASLASTLGRAAANPHGRVWHPEGCEGVFFGVHPKARGRCWLRSWCSGLACPHTRISFGFKKP